jgi:DNA polymerase
MMFDGAILSWRYNIKPKFLLDTLCMARALHGTEQSVSLKNVSERYGVGEKGTEVIMAKDKRLADFTEEELTAYAGYCKKDVDLTYAIFQKMQPKFPEQELAIIDATLRMFTEPSLELDMGMLEMHLEDVRDRKDKLMVDANITDRKDLMSNAKFAELLSGLGVTPPVKISPTTEKETFAFAKSDKEFQELQEHEDERVQTLVAARLGTKSTLEETRTQRFIDISKRGTLPVPIRYYAAHTGRWGGDDKINLQNLPSRGANGKKLKKSIIPPHGHTIVECDASQIEARVLAWLAEADELTHAFSVGEDVYVKMAAAIYKVDEADVTGGQRFVGKTTILGAGYGMGAKKFKTQLAGMGVEVDLAEARRVINIYRDTYWKIPTLWNEAQYMLEQLVSDQAVRVGRKDVLRIDIPQKAIILPSGLRMFYEDLQLDPAPEGVEPEDVWPEYSYKTRRGRKNIYGGKVVENVCQALARCIIGEQMLLINQKYKSVMTVHDSIAICCPDEEVVQAREHVEQCMRHVPSWAAGLPLECESGIGKSYGDTE